MPNQLTSEMSVFETIYNCRAMRRLIPNGSRSRVEAHTWHDDQPGPRSPKCALRLGHERHHLVLCIYKIDGVARHSVRMCCIGGEISNAGN